MVTTLFVRIILIVTSTLSVFLQILGMTGRTWYGFSLSMNLTGVKFHAHIECGLFHFSPLSLEACFNSGTGTVCKTPEQFPLEVRQLHLFESINTTVHDSSVLLKFLAINGLILSACGLILLYMFLSSKPNRQRRTGIACAFAWNLAALHDLVATGIQLFRNSDEENVIHGIEETLENQEIQIEAKLITAWAAIILGIGAILAIIVGLLVAITTCRKKSDDIVYHELKEKENAVLVLDVSSRKISARGGTTS